jgi:hypothetical protein
MPKLCTVPAGETISKGDAVCLSGWDTVPMVPRPTVTRATKANLDILKTIFGVAAADAAAGAVDILVAGEVADQDITSLGAGLSASRLVVTKYTLGDANHEAELRYIYETAHEGDVPPIYDAVSEQFVVGTSDKYGNLAIQPRHNSDETGYPKVYNLKAYGAVENWDAPNNVPTNDGTANLAAFNRALAAMQTDGNVGAKLVANGRFYFSNTLVLNQTIVFEGTSMNEPTAIGGPVVPDPVGVVTLRRSAPGTWLIFPAMNGPKRVTGIRLHSGALNIGGRPREVDAVPGLAASPADKTILRNLTIHCYHQNDMVPQGADETSALFSPIAGQSHGVHASTTFYAENVTVEFFAGDGFHIIGYYSNPAGPKNDDDYFGGSVDDSRLRTCTVGSCGRDGYHIYGTDATACLFDGCVAAGNRRYGFYDSTRQNTYIDCHAENNGSVALGPNFPAADNAIGAEYRTEGGSSIFIGCYAEGNGDRCLLDGDVTVIGGTIGNNNTSKDSTVFLLEHGVASRAPMAYYNDRGRADILALHPTYNPDAVKSLLAKFTLGTQNGNAVEAFQLTVTDYDPAKIPLQLDPLHPIAWDPPVVLDYSTLTYTDDSAGYGYRWWTLQNASVYRSVMRFPTTGANARYPAPWLTNGFFIGNENYRIGYNPDAMHFMAASNLPGAPPPIQFDGSAQTYEAGDVVWNSQPAPGNALGQVCTTAGTQGGPKGYRGYATTGSIVAGTTSLQLADATYFAVNQYITIAGLTPTFQIFALAAGIATLDQVAPAPGAVNAVVNVAATTGFANAADPHVTLDDATYFAVNQYITIAGVAGVFQILALDPPIGLSRVATLDGNPGAVAAGTAIFIVMVAWTTSGNLNVTVDDAAGLLVGQRITIAGVAPARITAISGTTVTVDQDPLATVTKQVVGFSNATFATFGSVRGTVTVSVTTNPQALPSSYETIKLTGNLATPTIITVPSEDGWSARFLDLTVRNGNTLTVQAATLNGTVYQLPNGQTQRLYIEYDGLYNIRPEGPSGEK